MRQKSFDTGRGNIVYWVSDEPDVARPWLVFLPGLTADHRLKGRSSTSKAAPIA